MVKLGRLIQGQDVAFDTHQSGDGQSVHWKELHLEKRLHKGGKIRFPFFGDRSPTSSERVSDKDYERVVREVRRELHKNEALRQTLAETVVSQIDRFREGTITIEVAREAANKIASMFDLSDDFISHAVVQANNRIAEYSTLHAGKRPGMVVEIVQSKDRIEIQKPKGTWQRWRGNAL